MVEGSPLARTLAKTETSVKKISQTSEFVVAALDEGAPLPESVLVDCDRDGRGELTLAHEGVQRVLELLQGWLSNRRADKMVNVFSTSVFDFSVAIL